MRGPHFETIPPELQDRIIDHLHSDNLALATCSLVCKTWLPASRYHFFQTQTLCLTNDNIHSFVELLNSPASTLLLGYALTVKISPLPPAPLSDTVIHSSIVIFDTISPHLSKLKIRSLCLEGVRWVVNKGKLEEIIKCFAAISELRLSAVIFSRPNEFIKFTSSFLALETFSVQDLAFFGRDDIAHTTLPLLRTIELCIAKNSTTWFLAAVQFPLVNTVCISNLCYRGMDAVQALLRSLGPSIHKLYLESTVGIHCDMTLDLTQNTNLRQLSLLGIGPRGGLSQIFSQITSFDVEVIEVEVVVSLTSNDEVVDWNPVVQVLTRPPFSKLQKVRLGVRCYFKTCCSGLHLEDLVPPNASILGNILDIWVCHDHA